MTDRARHEVEVPVDQFEIARYDVLLTAVLRSSFALCLYDELQEGGALLHLQIGRPGQISDPELTDNTLSTNLLLLDRCLADLRQVDPRARHGQAKFVAHAGERSGGRERLLGIQSFIEAYLDDVGIRLVAATGHIEAPVAVQFRPALGQLRCEPVDPQRVAP